MRHRNRLAATRWVSRLSACVTGARVQGGTMLSRRVRSPDPQALVLVGQVHPAFSPSNFKNLGVFCAHEPYWSVRLRPLIA